MGISASAWSQIPPYTADYYLVDAEKYINQPISVNVPYAFLNPRGNFKEGYTSIIAYTPNGKIQMLVADSQAKTFLLKYGNTTNVRTIKGRVSGKLQKEEHNNHLIPPYYLLVE